MNSETPVSEGYVQCRSCKPFFVCDPSTTRTSHLSRHSCKPLSNITSISSFFKTKRTCIASVHERECNRCSYMRAKDMQPFDVPRGRDFREVAGALIGIGVRYGRINAEDTLLHPTTVPRKVSEIGADLTDSIMPGITFSQRMRLRHNNRHHQ